MKRALAAMFAGMVAMLAAAAPAHAAPTDTVIIVIDGSASMAGANLKALNTAVKRNLLGLPEGVKIGLVVLTSKGTTRIAPTSDREQVVKAVAAVKAGGSTKLYDGIIAAARSAPSPTSTRLLVVTDGYDAGSRASRQKVVDTFDATGIALDVVTIAAKDSSLKAMKALTLAGNGRIFQAATSAQLGPAFVRALVQAAPSPVPSATPTPSASPSATPSPSASPVPEEPQQSWVWKVRDIVIGPLGLSVMAAMVAYFYGYILVVRALQRRHQRAMDRAIAIYDTSSARTTKKADDDISAFIEVPARRRRKAKKTNRARVAELRSKTFPVLANRLEAADIPYTAERWITLCLAVFLVLFLVLTVVTGVWFLALLLSAVLAGFGQNSYIKSKTMRFKRAFEAGLADFLVLIASGLRSGMSFVQSVDSASQEGSGPVERQFRRALGEVRVGSTLEAAMGRVAERMDSDDLRWTIAALAIQREVGGNLSKILDTAAATIRARADLKREVRTLSAEGRLSAYVLLALPVGIFFFLLLSRRAYVQVFWTEPMGFVMLGMFGAAVLSGWFWIRKIVAVEV